MDAQVRKDPPSLRNRYLTEDPEEIALALTQPVRELGIVVQGGRTSGERGARHTRFARLQ